MVSSATRFHRDHAALQLRRERDDAFAPCSATYQDPSRSIEPNHAAAVLAQIHPEMRTSFMPPSVVTRSWWRRGAGHSIKGGAETGPNPTDRGKPGTKRHLVTDAQGTPLGLTLSGANRHNSMMLASTLDEVPGVRNGQGRPRRRPSKLHADKAYDHKRCRRECRARSIAPRIARRGIETSQTLGRHRWVVERTFAWLNQFRRLAIR